MDWPLNPLVMHKRMYSWSQVTADIVFSSVKRLIPHHVVHVINVSTVCQQQSTRCCLSSFCGVCQWASSILSRQKTTWLSLFCIFIHFYPNVTTLRSGLCCRNSVCLSSVCRLSSVCLSSVTLVHPTQGVEPFGKLSSLLCTLAILWPPCKILRR